MPPERDPVVLPLQSAVPGQRYPAMPDPRAAPILTMFYQLEQAQWHPAQVQRNLAFSQLHELLRVATTQVPYYRESLRETLFRPDIPLSEEAWASVPILERRTVQEQGRRLLIEQIPKMFQPFNQVKSSGSTGTPIEAFHPATKAPSMYASLLLEHVLNNVDFSRKNGTIKHYRENPPPPGGYTSADWGGPLAALLYTGPSVSFDSSRDPEEQADWIIREDPAYLQMFPSSLEAVLPILKEKGADLPGLSFFRTMGEQLPDRLREKVRAQFGKRIVDVYSAQEVGAIALQCPRHDHYHLVHGMCFSEILGDDGTPCGPGEIGRVVVTDLFNPAFPLIRYDIGDFAEVGEPCDCGCNWPVITRIMGRVRNLITMPDGKRQWPAIPGRAYSEALPLIQYQVVQTALTEIHVKLVLKRPITEEDRSKTIAITKERFGAAFNVTVSQVERVERSAGGKFEEFRSEVSAS